MLTRLTLILMLGTAAASVLLAQATRQPEKGPIVDRVLFDVCTQEDMGLKDAAEGKTDIFMHPVLGSSFTSLPADMQKKLDLYTTMSGSWSLMINPIPDAAPYTVTIDGIEYFNPFAVKEVRYALNFLINRKYIVDEILGGAGGPMFTMAVPGQPGAYPYNLIPVKFGMTPTGDEKKAVQDITSALEDAARLPALQGKLVKGERFWQWNGSDLTVKVLIREDEPNGRLKEGRYVADQIEKAGIHVERLEWDRAKVPPAHEYWDATLTATELGLKEATRIPICYQSRLYAVNKARLARRMVYSVGDGLDAWSLVTADVPPDKSGEKVLRVTQLSVSGSLFTSAWDPVGVEGFKDLSSRFISSATFDRAAFVTPNSAEDAPLRASWQDVLTKVSIGTGDNGEPAVEGGIPVPADALVYDPGESQWVRVGPGVSSFSKATYAYKWGNWHDGIPIGIADIMYAQAFIWKWITNVGDNDRFYDAGYESVMRSARDAIKGIVINPDRTITVYFNFNHVAPGRIGASAAVYTSVSASGRPVSCSWEIIEALAKIVAEGGVSGTAWSFSSDPAYTEVDVLDHRCVQDIRAKLQEFIDTSYVPPSIKQFTNPEDCGARYRAAIAWIDTHHNAYISNGPFYVNSVDLSANVAELKAFRDPSYPFDAGSWNGYFRMATTRVDAIAPPPVAPRGKPLAVTVKVSTIEYPETAGTPADATARVKLTLALPGAERMYSGVFVRPGQFSVTIPALDTKGLAAGRYTITAESQLHQETPSIAPSTIVLF